MIAKQVGTLEMGRTAAFFIILAIAALGLALAVSSGAVNASVPNQGGPPHVFLGSAIINGDPAPEGTVVAALINGVAVSTVEVNASGRYGNILVSTAGAAVTFTIGGLPAAETATSEAGAGHSEPYRHQRGAACRYSRSAHCGSRAGTTRGLQRQLRLEPGPKLLQWRRRHGITDPAPTGTGGLGRTAPEASRLLVVERH